MFGGNIGIRDTLALQSANLLGVRSSDRLDHLSSRIMVHLERHAPIDGYRPKRKLL